MTCISYPYLMFLYRIDLKIDYLKLGFNSFFKDK